MSATAQVPGEEAEPLRLGNAGRMRVVGRSALIFGWLLVCVPLFYLWKPFTRHNPWARAFLGGVARIMGVRVRWHGERPRRDAMLLSNHVSWLDIPILARLTGTAFVAQDGLAQIGWLRWLCSLNDTVFISRERRLEVNGQIEAVRTAIAETGALTIFPEGTTSDGIELLPFKSALLSAITPLPERIRVQPVYIDYGPESPDIGWLGTEPGGTNYARLAARARPMPVTVHFLAPLADDAVADRKTMAAAAQAAIAGAMAGKR